MCSRLFFQWPSNTYFLFNFFFSIFKPHQIQKKLTRSSKEKGSKVELSTCSYSHRLFSTLSSLPLENLLIFTEDIRITWPLISSHRVFYSSFDFFFHLFRFFLRVFFYSWRLTFTSIVRCRLLILSSLNVFFTVI